MHEPNTQFEFTTQQHVRLLPESYNEFNLPTPSCYNKKIQQNKAAKQSSKNSTSEATKAAPTDPSRILHELSIAHDEKKIEKGKHIRNHIKSTRS